MRRFLICLLLLAAACVSAALGEEAAVTVSEVMASNGTYTDGHAYDWVELHNVSGKTLDLSGWFLSDSAKKPYKWAFPEGAKISKDGYVLIYCTGEELSPGKGSVFYANFKLSADGDQVLLTSADGETMAELEFPAQWGNISYGRDQGGAYGYFETATPGKANGKEACAGRAQAPALQLKGGYYAQAVTVTATAQEGAVIRYTTDGSTPTAKSARLKEEGLTVKKTTALRVKAFADGLVSSQTVSATYLIGEEQPVPAVCLTTDEKYLFDQKTGALVRGTGSMANYEKELEYPVHIEYYAQGGEQLISQMGTFTASGHSARQNRQKSIALYARKAWGPEYFSFNPFPNRDYPFYKSLLLRAANSDWHSTRLRDPVISSLAEGLDLIYQDALPIEVYINGKYWGHYNLREKINKYFIAQWEGVPLSDEATVDGMDILARTGSDQFVQRGSNEDWLALCDFCKTQDLNVPENLQWVTERLDVDSLFTHAAFEIIIGNVDVTNVRVYRLPGGKWKYLLFDVEAGFGSSSDSKTVPLENYIKDVDAKINAFRHEPLNALLSVPEMKAKFLTRFAEILEHSFLWPDVEAKFAPWEEVLEQLLPRHIDRWGNWTVKTWRTNVNATKYYARVRPRKVVSMLAKRMKLTEEEVETYFGDVQRQLDEMNIV